MRELILVRHGETDANQEKRFQGHQDVPLNDAGIGQAARLARRMTWETVDAVYSSDLIRARQTAEVIATALGLPTRLLPELREIDVGRAVGWTREELRRRHPELFGEAWAQAPFPGGESYEQMAGRLERAVQRMEADRPGDKVLAVTHGGAIRSLLSRLTGIPLHTLVGVVVANTSLTRLRRDRSGAWRLHVLNDAAHLEGWADGPLCDGD